MDEQGANPDLRRCEACGEPLGPVEVKCARCGWFTPPPPPPEIPAWALSPPLAVLEGVVKRLLPTGFEVRTDSGSWVRVGTMTDGRRLALRTGERVRVSGGFAADGRFASGWMFAGQGAREREVADRPRDPWWRALFSRRV